MPQNKNPNRSVLKRNAANPTSKRKGDSYVLAIAIDNYQHHPTLNNAVQDAEDLIAILSTKYAFTNVVRLFNTEATKERILAALDQLVEKIQPSDSLLIYFAGHGYYHESTQTGHLISQEASSRSGYLSNADLKDIIKAIKSLHTLLIVDSCFSGSLLVHNRASAEVQHIPLLSLAEKVEGKPSRWCLAAGTIEEVSDGLHGQNSPFAKSILSYLQHNQSYKFPVSALIEHVKKVTAHNALQTPIGGILFKTDSLGGEFVFTLKEQPTGSGDQVTQSAIPLQPTSPENIPTTSRRRRWLALLLLPLLYFAFQLWPEKEVYNPPSTYFNYQPLSNLQHTSERQLGSQLVIFCLSKQLRYGFGLDDSKYPYELQKLRATISENCNRIDFAIRISDLKDCDAAAALRTLEISYSDLWQMAARKKYKIDFARLTKAQQLDITGAIPFRVYRKE